MKRIGPARLWKQFALAQILIVSGLMLENTPSITRLTTVENMSSSVIAYFLAAAFLVFAFTYFRRHIWKKEKVIPPKFVSYLLGMVAIAFGCIAAIITNASVWSPVLVIGYLWYAYLFAHGAHEVERERRECQHDSQS